MVVVIIIIIIILLPVANIYQASTKDEGPGWGLSQILHNIMSLNIIMVTTEEGPVSICKNFDHNIQSGSLHIQNCPLHLQRSI